MADDRRFEVTSRVSAKEVGGELVLLDLEEGTFHVAKGTGPRAWEILARGGTVEEVAEAIATRYGRAVDEVRGDVAAFVADLLERGFLVEPPESPL
jgi:hypothetical protein